MTRLQDVPIVRTKFPANVHVLGVVSNESNVMPSNFFMKKEIVTKSVFAGSNGCSEAGRKL